MSAPTKNIKNITTIFLAAGLVVASLVILFHFSLKTDWRGSFFANAQALQPPEPNVYGWAWSSNIGWLSFNCDQPEIGRNVCSSSLYGVKIDETTGKLSGFAWSEALGWIHFDPAGPYPNTAGSFSGPAQLDISTRAFKGWARACNAMADPGNCEGPGDPNQTYGWINLSGISVPGNAYEVSLDATTGELHGWAFGGPDLTDTAIVSWISFNCQENPTGGCSYPYRVYTSASLSPPGQITDLSVVPPFQDAFCQASRDPSAPPPLAAFSVTFTAPGNDAQDLAVEIFDESGALAHKEVRDVTSTPGGGTETFLVAIGFAPNQLPYDQTYSWQATLTTASSSASEPALAPYRVPRRYPKVDFSYEPEIVIVGDEIRFKVRFTTELQAFSPAVMSPEQDAFPQPPNFCWRFNFNPASDPYLVPSPPGGCDDTIKEPIKTFADPKIYLVAFSAWDEADDPAHPEPSLGCTQTKSINLVLSPQYLEPAPRPE